MASTNYGRERNSRKRSSQYDARARRAITKVTLPDTITEIGEFAFFKCRSLSGFDIPPKLAEIPKGMLDLTGIVSIEIGGNVKRIGLGAFYWCNDLKSAVLREGVEELESAVFYNCSGLETVELPRSLTKIADGRWDNSFYNCRNMMVTLYKGSYAELFCSCNKIPFKYKDLSE